jgi:Na+-transporting methylmalonyl-CoA/oxaloacetate decarboxylase gamma subunit
MKLSFREKSIWISLISTVLFFGYYFLRAFNEIFYIKDYSPGLIFLFIIIIILIIVVQIISHIIIAVSSKTAREEAQECDDERDRLIKAKGMTNSHHVLSAGVWITCLWMPFLKTTFIMANILMLFFVLAAVFDYATQLVYYRKGV